MSRPLLILLSLIVVGCASSRPSSEAMSEGERLYRANCASCHALRNPRNYTDGEWEIYLRKYGEKIELDSAGQSKILDYLQAVN